MKMFLPRPARTLTAFLALFMLVLLAGCSGGGSESSGGDGGVELVTEDNKFADTSVEVTAGEVSITVKNEGEQPHNFSISELGVDTGTIDPGGSKTVSFDAPEGTTEFVCNIHEASDNMKGTITAA